MADRDRILQDGPRDLAPGDDRERASRTEPDLDGGDLPWPLRPVSELLEPPRPQEPDATKP